MGRKRHGGPGAAPESLGGSRLAQPGAGMSPSAGVITAYRFPIPARTATAAGSYQLPTNGAFTMVFSRLANLRTRRHRSRAPIVLIGAHDGTEGLWEPLSMPQSQGGGLAPAIQPRTGWTVGSQSPRRQTTLSDLITRYQHFIARTERKRPHARFEVK